MNPAAPSPPRAPSAPKIGFVSLGGPKALAKNGKGIVTGRLGAKGGGQVVRDLHPSVLAVTGPHATHEVMDAVHSHLLKPHDPFCGID